MAQDTNDSTRNPSDEQPAADLDQVLAQLRAAHADTVDLRAQVLYLEQVIVDMEAAIPLIVAGARRPLLARIAELTGDVAPGPAGASGDGAGLVTEAQALAVNQAAWGVLPEPVSAEGAADAEAFESNQAAWGVEPAPSFTVAAVPAFPGPDSPAGAPTSASTPSAASTSDGSLKLLFHRAERRPVSDDDPVELLLAREVLRLRDDNERLAGLVAEMLPVFAADVRAGVELGAPPEGHDDDCDDCIWYRESLERAARLDAGEFGEEVRRG